MASSKPRTHPRWRRPPRLEVAYDRLVTVDSQSEGAEAAAQRGTIALVRGVDAPKLLVMACPCGCARVRRISTSKNVHPSWRLKLDPARGVSLFPSVVIETECHAHFVLWENVAYVF